MNCGSRERHPRQVSRSGEDERSVSEPEVRLIGTGEVITNCKTKVSTYIQRHAYVPYDVWGTIGGGPPDQLTERHLDAIIGSMHAYPYRSAGKGRAAWSPYLYQAIPSLAAVSFDLDLIDGQQAEVDRANDRLSDVVCTLSAAPQITDVQVSKMLHLQRPNFVAIADKIVRTRLRVTHEVVGPWDRPRDSWGKWYGLRWRIIQERMRELGQANRDTLNELQTWMRDLLPIKAARKPLKGEMVDVLLSKVRLLDIILWMDS